jgi:hypothetical protein
VIEMENLFPEVEVLEQSRAAQADLEAILIVSDRNALLRGQRIDVLSGDLMELTALTDLRFEFLGSGCRALVLADAAHDSAP